MQCGLRGVRLGKPTKCTADVTAAICQSLAAGVDVETAARREGIGRRTIYEWRERAEKGEEPFAGFFDACEVALAECEVEVTRGILGAARRDWKAGAWWLKWRALRGVNRVEHSAPGGKPLGVLSQATVQLIRERILYGEQGAPAAVPRRLVETTAEAVESEP